MNKAIDNQRNYGIDLFKIFAMLLVVILHVLGQGSALSAAGKTGVNAVTAWSLEAAAYCAVNCYAIASGYVGLYAKYRWSNLVSLWLRVLFYSIGITIFFAIFFPGTVDGEVWKKALIPTMAGTYWYFTAYAGLFLFMPILNKGMDMMEEKPARRMLIAMCVVFFAGYFFFDQTFSLNFGYSIWWLMVMYLLGAYLRKFDVLQSMSKRTALLGYFLMIFLSVGVKFSIPVLVNVLGWTENSVGIWLTDRCGQLIKYRSLTVIAEAVFLFRLFYDLKMPNAVNKVIKLLAPLSFSVYLIHVHPCIWNQIMHRRFSSLGKASPIVMIAGVLGNAVLIYLICSCIDFFREVLFRKMKVKQRLLILEKHICK